MTPPAVCLVVMFNHAYPANIERLRRLYGKRFSRIVFLMPNQRVPDPACFTGYRGSFSSHGLVADARDFLLAQDADTYLFAADDLILNPTLDESTIVDALGLREHDGFLTRFEFLAGQCLVDGPTPRPGWPTSRDWLWTRRVLSRLQPRNVMHGSGVEGHLADLPDRETALRKFLRYGAPLLRLEMPPPARRGPARLIAWRNRPTTHELPLPLAHGISDLFAVRRARLDRLAHYLGVFAAMDLFVEVAIPTALILAVERLVTARGASWEYSWAPSGPGVDAAPFASLADLEARFPASQLFVHPVKLSRLAL